MVANIIPVMTAMYLGSTFNLGTYRKGNADVFDDSILKGNLQVIDRSFTKSQYKLVESSLEARNFLDVDGALSLKIKKGEVSISGPGAYLSETVNRDHFVELLVRVEHETVTETIPSHLKPKTQWMDKDPSRVGTHYVRSITYGGELVASLRLKASNRTAREKIKAAVTANLQLSGTFDLNANGSFDKLKEDLAGMYDVEIKIMATKAPSSPATTVEELMKVVDEYPAQINAIDNGKGKALKAELYPLSSLKKDFPLYMPNRALNSLLDDVEVKYDDIRLTSADFSSWIRAHHRLTDEQEKKLSVLSKKMRKVQTEFHVAIAELDGSSKGKLSQFTKAFEEYGKGAENIPGKYSRLFAKLRHELTDEPIVWDRPTGSGVVYNNWGTKGCSSKSHTVTQVLYTGHAVGTSSTAWNGGKDFHCLPDEDPEQSRALIAPSKAGTIESVHYRSLMNAEETDIMTCAVCLAKRKIVAKTFHGMMTCPDGWNLEYSGYLTADSASYVDRDFLCINKDISNPEVELQATRQTPHMNFVFMVCENCNGDKVVPCVVCTR